MQSTANKQNVGWGVLLISFGVSAILDQYTGVSDWYKIGVFLLGGLITLAFFLADRSDWVLLIPAYVMLAISAIGAAALGELLDGDLMASFVLPLVAAPFLVVYLRNRDNWWALFPTFILLAIALMLFVTNIFVLKDSLIAPFVLFAIAAPFLFVYFNNRQNWWALIPAYVMIVIGIMVGLIETNVLDDLLVPAYINLAIALPFFWIYFRNRDARWALFPGGIMGLIGLGFLFSEPIGQFIFPLAMIAAGVWVLYRQARK